MLIYRFVRVATYGLRHGGHFHSDVTMPSLLAGGQLGALEGALPGCFL